MKPRLALLLIFLLGCLIRGLYIFVGFASPDMAAYRGTYVASDMGEYLRIGAKMWEASPTWAPADTIYPPGGPYFYSRLLGPSMDRLERMFAVQFLMAEALCLLVWFLADRTFGRRAGWIAFLVASLAPPLFEYNGFVLAEPPFAFLVLVGTALAWKGLRSDSPALFALSGMAFGLSASFKAVGLLSGLALLPALLFPITRRRLFHGAALVWGLALAVTPACRVATEQNGGRFLLLSNDVFRLALVNCEEPLGVVCRLPDGQDYTVISPVGAQKLRSGMRQVPFDRAQILRENREWVLAHPLKAAVQICARLGDLLIGTIPFPAMYTPYKDFESVSQLVMLLFVYVPAGLALLRRDGLARQRWLFVLPVTSVFVTALIAATEPRYLHPFSPLLIVLAAEHYARSR